jgi:hypothetical protein
MRSETCEIIIIMGRYSYSKILFSVSHINGFKIYQSVGLVDACVLSVSDFLFCVVYNLKNLSI